VAQRYSVVVVQPPGYLHSAAFEEVAETLLHALRALGQDVVRGHAPLPDRRSIVLGANLLASHPLPLPADAILYNLEQIDPQSTWMTGPLLELYRKHEVWDYSLRNAARYPEMGLPAPRVVPVGSVPELSRIAPADEDIDVLFYGSMNERRRAVLAELSRRGLRAHAAFGVYGTDRDRLVARAKVVLNVHYYEAKVFEIVRVSYLLANGRCVVSERGADPAEEREFEDGVAFADYGRLADACEELCGDAAKRRRVADAGRRVMEARDARAFLSRALGLPWLDRPPSPSPPALPRLADRRGDAETARAGVARAGIDPCGGPDPTVSIVVPVWNEWVHTFRCLLSLKLHTQDVPHETIVVDDASTDETRIALPRLNGIRVLRNESNLGPARARNQGARVARGRYVLFSNGGAEAQSGWLSPMVRILDQEPDVGVVGAKLLYPDGTLQHAGLGVAYASPLPISPFPLDHRKPAETSRTRRDLPAVSGSCLLIRRDLCEALGGFDEAYVNGLGDVDLCFRVRERGWRIVYTPESVLCHHGSVSPGPFDRDEGDVALLHRRWMGRFREFTEDRRLNRAPRRTGPDRRPLSVVVATLDSISGVARCLEDIRDELLPFDELVVADGGSTDPTVEFVRGFVAENPQARLVQASGLAAALHAGLAVAREEECLVIPAAATAGADLLDEVSRALAPGPGLALVVPLPGALLVAGPTAALRRAARQRPRALLEPDGEACASVLRAERCTVRTGLGSSRPNAPGATPHVGPSPHPRASSPA